MYKNVVLAKEVLSKGALARNTCIQLYTQPGSGTGALQFCAVLPASHIPRLSLLIRWLGSSSSAIPNSPVCSLSVSVRKAQLLSVFPTATSYPVSSLLGTMSEPLIPRSKYCNCCYGLWKPSWGRDRITPGDTARSWYFTNPIHFSILRYVLPLKLILSCILQSHIHLSTWAITSYLCNGDPFCGVDCSSPVFRVQLASYAPLLTFDL